MTNIYEQQFSSSSTLVHLNLSNNKLINIENGIKSLINLKKLFIHENNINSLNHSSIRFTLNSLTNIGVQNSYLKQFIIDDNNMFNNLSEIDISFNQIILSRLKISRSFIMNNSFQ